MQVGGVLGLCRSGKGRTEEQAAMDGPKSQSGAGMELEWEPGQFEHHCPTNMDLLLDKCFAYV